MKKILSTVFVLAAVACVVVAFVMFKYPAIEVGENPNGYTLWETAFGCKDNNGQKVLEVSLLNILPYLLLCGVLGGLIVQFIAIFAKQKQGGKKLFTPFAIVVLMIFFIGAGILFLYAKEFINFYVPDGLDKKLPGAYEAAKEQFLSLCELGKGAVVAAVSCFIGAGMELIAGIMHFALKDKN